MADEMNKEREAAETWLRDRYGAYRGHFAWRELEEAFLAGRASLAASAGSEPVAIRDVIAHFRLTHWADEDGGLGLADALAQLYGDDDIGRANEELDALADAISEVVTHPSPPEGAGWQDIATAPKDGALILARGEGCSAIALMYANGWKYESGNISYLNPTHWMPLPAPPASEAKGE